MAKKSTYEWQDSLLAKKMPAEIPVQPVHPFFCLVHANFNC